MKLGKKTLYIIILGLFLVVSCKTAKTTVTNSLPLKKEIEDIRDKFIEEVKKEGYSISYIPKVKINTTPQLIYFIGNKKKGTLVAPDWDSAHENVQKMMNTWMKESNNKYTGKGFFEENFNWFLPAHELGHYLQITQNIKGANLEDLWENELYANKVAIAFWLKQGEEEKLEAFIAEVIKVSNYLSSPVPEGEDEKIYFNEHYHELGADPTKYGYFQFLLYKKAWEEKDSLNRVVITEK